MELRWDAGRRLIYWSKDSLDQGIHITGIMPAEVPPPVLPFPKNDTYLYFEFSSTLAYMTVYDNLQRLTGFNPQTGQWQATVPNSSLVLASYIPVKDTPFNVPEEEVLIVNPQGKYQIVVTAGGNTGYSLFMSKTTSTDEDIATNSFGGSLSIGDSKTFQVDSGTLASTVNTVPVFPLGIISMVAVIFTLILFVSLVLALLARRRKRILRLRPDYDEFRFS